VLRPELQFQREPPVADGSTPRCRPQAAGAIDQSPIIGSAGWGHSSLRKLISKSPASGTIPPPQLPLPTRSSFCRAGSPDRLRPGTGWAGAAHASSAHEDSGRSVESFTAFAVDLLSRGAPRQQSRARSRSGSGPDRGQTAVPHSWVRPSSGPARRCWMRRLLSCGAAMDHGFAGDARAP